MTLFYMRKTYTAGKYVFKVNNRNTKRTCQTCSKLTISIPERRCWRYWRLSSIFPANIRLDEDVLKTSFVFIFRRRLEDAFKTNMFALALRLQKTSSRRFQVVLVKTNTFVLAIRLQEVFKTFSRRLQDDLQKRLQDIFKTSCKDIFKMFSRRIIKLNCSC